MLGQALLYLLSKPMCEELEQENLLVDGIDRIGQEAKRNKDSGVIMNELELFRQQWRARLTTEASVRMPYNISYCTKDIEVKLNKTHLFLLRGVSICTVSTTLIRTRGSRKSFVRIKLSD